MIRIAYLWKAIFSDDMKRGDRGRGTYCLEVKQVVTVSISLQLITAMWLNRNKISIY